MAESSLNFEQDMDQLSKIVDQLGSGDLSLEDAITSFQKGIQLSNQLQEVLTKAQTQLNQVVDDQDQVKPLD